jgi:hypothetical protein
MTTLALYEPLDLSRRHNPESGGREVYVRKGNMRSTIQKSKFTVKLVSAILVARTIFLTPSGGRSNIRSCSVCESLEWTGKIQ